MTVLYLILLLLAAVCFALEAFTDVRASRVHLIGAGLFFWVLVPLIQTVQTV